MAETFLTHLECSDTGKHYPIDTLHNLSESGKQLLVQTVNTVGDLFFVRLGIISLG
ncbi:MAG: hypothetical protein JKY88_17055 [Pseudomonadales bacterium]|nr:hypothetical protein [Pseudomonadales bacterium]